MWKSKQLYTPSYEYTHARTGGMQDVQSNVIAGAGGGNVNMLQQLPHFFMICGAATEQKRALPHCCPVKT